MLSYEQEKMSIISYGNLDGDDDKENYVFTSSCREKDTKDRGVQAVKTRNPKIYFSLVYI